MIPFEVDCLVVSCELFEAQKPFEFNLYHVIPFRPVLQLFLLCVSRLGTADRALHSFPSEP